MADYVNPIVEWTEKNIKPEVIPASTATASGGFTRPLCVYPKLARYKGKGDPDEASSYRCSVK